MSQGQRRSLQVVPGPSNLPGLRKDKEEAALKLDLVDAVETKTNTLYNRRKVRD